MTVSNAFGSVTSSAATLAVNQTAITTQPAGATVNAGASATFTVAAAGMLAPTYQWYFNGQAIPGATNSSYTVSNAQITDEGAYVAMAANFFGGCTSDPANLIVLSPPIITTQPVAQTVSAGGAATLSVVASSALNYQWQLNGAPISGATNATLALANTGTTQGGVYTVVASNTFGMITSNPVSVTVNVSSHLYNISSRAYVGSGPYQNLVAGFYTDGSGSKNVVVRGIGPNLAVVDPLLGGGILAAPILTVFDANAAVLARNTAWGGAQVLVNAFANVYAAPLQPNSNDTAAFLNLPAGPGIGYTAEVDGLNSATGVALVEIDDYDSYTGAPTSHLVNISTRAFAGKGSQALVAGFWTIGSTSQTVLIRALGPALPTSAPALSGMTLPRPILTLFDASGNVIASNSGWSNPPVAGNSAVAAGLQPATATIMSEVYATPLSAGSADCAMVVTLPPNAGYTAQVSSADSSTGVAMVEIDNVP